MEKNIRIAIIGGGPAGLSAGMYLEKKGYVERRSDQHDKRAICVYPTQKMLDILPEVKKIVKDWNDYLTKDIAPGDLECFNRVLDQIAERAKKYIYEKEETDK